MAGLRRKRVVVRRGFAVMSPRAQHPVINGHARKSVIVLNRFGGAVVIHR